MRIERTVYFITTKDRPVFFHGGDGYLTDDFAEAEIYNFMDEAESEIEEMDAPDSYEIVKGTIGCEV